MLGISVPNGVAPTLGVGDDEFMFEDYTSRPEPSTISQGIVAFWPQPL